MKANFIVNEYILVWYILFNTLSNKNLCDTKKRLWKTFKNQYNATYKDKELILNNPKDFIPNNDIIYNILFENTEYQKIKKQTDKYRLKLLSIWDKNSKLTDYLYKNIIRKKVNNYTFFVVYNELNIIDFPKDNVSVIGLKLNERTPANYLLKLNLSLASKITKKYKNNENNNIRQAILELAILNEYASKILRSNCYLVGSHNLERIEHDIYPYWLMYLGVPRTEFKNRMLHDQVIFDTSKYTYNHQLKKLNIEEFIDFCIENKKDIIKNNNQEIEILDDLI